MRRHPAPGFVAPRAGAIWLLAAWLGFLPARAGTLRVTALDNDGPAGGYATCLQWKDSERDFVFLERKGFLPEGEATFTLPPGRYRVAFEYHETTPRQTQDSESFDVTADSAATQSFVFARASLRVFARDAAGWAVGYATCRQWDDRERDFSPVDSAGPLDTGKHTFQVPPGRYRVRYEYRATVPHQTADSEPLTLTNGANQAADFLFPRASIAVFARDHAGWAPGHAVCLQWQDAERDFVQVDHKPFLDQGKCVFLVPPGRYKIHYDYRKSELKQGLESRELTATNGMALDQEFYFPTGTISVFARDGTGWAAGILQFSLWDDQAQAYGPPQNKGYLPNGKTVLQVPPGRYRLTYEYREQEPFQVRTQSDLVVTDAARLTCDFAFGAPVEAPAQTPAAPDTPAP